MKNCAKSLAKSSAPLSAFALLFFAASATARAQGRNSSMPSPAVVERNAEQDMMSREWNLTHIPDQVNGQFKTEQVSVFRQVQEDFTNLQVANNKMMQAVFVAKNLDYKLITATNEEIKKRALRLKGNLMLPKVADKEQGRHNPPPPYRNVGGTPHVQKKKAPKETPPGRAGGAGPPPKKHHPVQRPDPEERP